MLSAASALAYSSWWVRERDQWDGLEKGREKRKASSTSDSEVEPDRAVAVVASDRSKALRYDFPVGFAVARDVAVIELMCLLPGILKHV